MSTSENKPAAPVAAAMPPAPPGESPPEAVAQIRAVSEALTRLGDRADERALAAHVKSATGIDLSTEEVAAIRGQLLEKARPPEQRSES
jgi:hypothetical protein